MRYMVDITHFNLTSYENLLTTARENNYRFILFDDRNRYSNNVCIIRHDIDADMGAAHIMAKVEFENDVKATYFVMIRSPLYNLFSRHNSKYVERILDMGHTLGIHYDASFHKKHEYSLKSSIADEISILETEFDTCVDTISFHQPNQDILKGNLSIPYKINTYNTTDMSGYLYISDSNMQFSHENPFDVFKSRYYSKIHLLIHPLWWVYSDITPEDIWERVIIHNFELSQHQLLDTEGAYGNRRIMSLRRSDIT